MLAQPSVQWGQISSILSEASSSSIRCVCDTEGSVFFCLFFFSHFSIGDKVINRGSNMSAHALLNLLN